MSTRQQRLTTEDRLCIIQTLNALPRAQFNELLFALGPPSGNIPDDAAAQSDRSAKLLEWAESPVGPGLPSLEKTLSKVIATHSKTAEQFLAFVISGKISPSTAAELHAFVELLRKKTGDNSIDIAFFQEGSIKLILNGSPEGLAKLQELLEAGELEQLGIPPVEAVTPMDGNTEDARKARLIQALKLRTELSKRVDARNLYIISRSDLARGFARGFALIRARDLNKADLSGANLRGLDLRGVDLTEADLSYADVTDTIFGDNQGLTEADKRDLQGRGAIFQDSPGSDVPSLVLR